MLRSAQRLQPLLSMRGFSAAGCARHCANGSAEAAPDVGQRVAASFRESPAAAASSIAEALRPSDRLRLLAALSEASRTSADALEDSYVDKLFKMADKQAPLGSLARAELKAALELDRVMSSAAGGQDQAAKPSLRTLASLALAVGLPFIGFGFFDNFIMILAGEEIENQFGARLGLSTLAAAGLGNLLSDICGLGLADQIEAQSNKVMRPIPLSTLQQRMVRTRVAKVGGMTVGVTVGCLLGMVPCLWLEPHSRVQPQPCPA